MSDSDFRLIDTNLPPEALLDRLANEYNRNATQLQAILSGGITSANQRCHIIELDLELSASVTMAGAWASSSNPNHEPIGCFRDSSGEVCVVGVATGGAIGDMLTLPSGYRPRYDEVRLVSVYEAGTSYWGKIVIFSSGVMQALAVEGGAAANDEWWLGGIRFSTDEVRQPFPKTFDVPFGSPSGVYVWKVENKAHRTYQHKGSVGVVWEPTGKSGIRIIDIPGLREGSKYRVSLIAVSE